MSDIPLKIHSVHPNLATNQGMAVPPRISDASWKDSWRVEWPILATENWAEHILWRTNIEEKTKNPLKTSQTWFTMFTFVQFKLS